MHFIKRQRRPNAKVSLILLDWSVRESFHVLHYLSTQTAPRDSFEVIILEFYDSVSERLQPFEKEVDTWVALEMPKGCYYHKHYMYNIGIVLATADIVMIGDSDAMVKPTFIQRILDRFTADSAIVYHMDQFRNMRRDFYPFSYPSFEEVLGDGCFNNANGVTTGILETKDPIHARNYGACMCARRQDLIAIGGADMHITYLGHICGPYDMTFRLVNRGCREIWETEEFLYHTWHPGQAGADNYLGPHDGRHMSTTALEALTSGRVAPLLENPAIRALRDGKSRDEALAEACPSHYAADWDMEAIRSGGTHERWVAYKRPMGTYNGFRMVAEVDRVLAYPLTERDAGTQPGQADPGLVSGHDVAEVRRKIDAATPGALKHLALVGKAWSLVRRAWASLEYRARVLPLPVPTVVKAFVAAPIAPIVLLALLPFRHRRITAKIATVLNTSNDPNIGILAATLYNLAKWGRIEASSRTVLVVADQTTRDSLQVLWGIRLIPPLRVEVLAAAPSFDALISALDQDQSVQCVLLPASLHQDHHGAVAGSRIGKVCVVV